MFLCYVDESGTPELPGNTSHFVLAGFAIPIWHWPGADREISTILARYDLSDKELHTAWLLRPYLEQSRIPNFERLSRPSRRSAVERERNGQLLRLQQNGRHDSFLQQRKNFSKTADYVHLTYDERVALVRDVADCVSQWGFARLFAECIDKLHFDPARTGRAIEEQAFEQVVSRFERFLRNTTPVSAAPAINTGTPHRMFGLLVHDNNQTVARKHTKLMRQFHQNGTLWTEIGHIIETPMFVDSSLTSMVQVADLCAYALRRYVEKQEEDLFNRVFRRADRSGTYTVGVRHFANQPCNCKICATHN